MESFIVIELSGTNTAECLGVRKTINNKSPLGPLTRELLKHGKVSKDTLVTVERNGTVSMEPVPVSAYPPADIP